MNKRVAVGSAIGLVLLVAAGYFIYDRIGNLEEQVAGLGRQLDDTEQRLADSEARAAAAAQAARSAQARANAADQRAVQAEQQASTSEEARIAAQQARDVAEMESRAAQDLAQNALDAEAQAREEARRARDEADRIRLQREAELNRMQEALQSIVETRRTAVGMVLNLGDRVEFEFDEAELRAPERELLARIAGVLIASAGQGYAIQVFGHTDDVGSAGYNQQLSERRAQAVMEYLVDAGVDPAIMTMQGMGKTLPLVADTTEQARARNRRVEIAIVDTLIEFRPGR